MKTSKSLRKEKKIAIEQDDLATMASARSNYFDKSLRSTARKSRDKYKEIGVIAVKNGYKIITVMNLVRLLGNKKRSPQIIKNITDNLEKNKLFSYPKLTMNLKPDEILRIYSFPVKALGDLFDTENDLEGFIEENDLFGELGLVKPHRQFRPNQTRDRFDFKCLDKAGNEVALELKNLHGGKSAVEQVLRYLGMLKQQFKGKKVRGILVTGILGVDTAKALHGMTEEQKNVIDWYLYNYNKNTQHLIFEKVNYKFIAEHLDNG